jgi:ketol-acid reductoisomerase
MTMIYYEEDADFAIIANQVISVIGYNSLARAVAHNLRDSGIHVLVSGDGEEQAAAARAGFNVASIAAATARTQIIMLLTSDERMVQTYIQEVSPNLQKGNTLIFASAYNVSFGFIEPPPFVDVGLVSPRTIGETLRERFVQGHGFPSFVAVWQDASRDAWGRVLAVARGIGALQAGAIEINIEQEAEINLFVQQAILPTVHHMLVTAAELMMKQGYPAEAVLLDLYLGGKFTDYMQQSARSGLLEALKLTNQIGQYSTYSRMERFKELKLERLMEVTLDEIRNGDFAREWAREHSDGQPRLSKMQKQYESSDLWELEQQTLDMIGDDLIEVDDEYL